MRIWSGLWPIFMPLLAGDLNSRPWASGYGASTLVLGRSNNVYGVCFLHLSTDSWRYVGPAPIRSANIWRAKVRTLFRHRTGMWDHWSHKPSYILASRVAGLQDYATSPGKVGKPCVNKCLWPSPAIYHSRRTIWRQIFIWCRQISHTGENFMMR
jgi:hypothetical protein